MKWKILMKFFMKINLHIGDEIRKELNFQERSVAWLANRIGSDSSNLRKKLNSSHIQEEWLYKISIALKKDFFSLYSQQLSDEIQV